MASLIDVFNSQTRDLIDAAVEAEIKPARHGYRLRASEIADPCERKLWAGLRWLYAPEQTKARNQRIFDVGNNVEDRYIADLRKVEQFEVVDSEWNDYKWKDEQIGISFGDGHGYGYLDLEVLGLPEAPKTWHVGEVKSASQTDYNALLKHGVQAKKPLWYGQGQLYAHIRGRTRIVFFVECKNDQQRNPFRLEYDAHYAMNLVVKAERIAFADVPPVRAFSKPDDRGCLFCRAKEWCWTEKPIDIPRTCRSCVHVEPISKGKWACNRNPACARPLKREDQEAGCEHHEFIPSVKHWEGVA